MLTDPNNAEDAKMIAELEAETPKLTEWETSFLEGLRVEIAEQGAVTPSQRAVLSQIHAEKVLGW